MRILVTGADSLTGSHILSLLSSESQCSIRATIRSKEQANGLQCQESSGPASLLEFVVIPETNELKPGAFDDALHDTVAPIHTVVHILTATSLHDADCLARYINLQSETLIQFLETIRLLATEVRRVVLVSSLTLFAKWLATDPRVAQIAERTATHLDSIDPEDILATSQAGDNIIHDSISRWHMRTEASFDIVYIIAPGCYGPSIYPLETSSDLLEANRRIWNICSNRTHDLTDTSPYGLAHFVDVRDLAVACVRAIFTAEAGNQRFFISAGIMLPDADIETVLVDRFPELRNVVRIGSTMPQLSPYDNTSLESAHTQLAGRLSGLAQFRSVQETLIDTTLQILDLQRRKKWKNIIES